MDKFEEFCEAETRPEGKIDLIFSRWCEHNCVSKAESPMSCIVRVYDGAFNLEVVVLYE